MFTVSNRAANRRTSRGFTLIELLVTLTIISILASVTLGALYASQESARKARTESTIAKINDLVTTRWDAYRTRRLPVATGTSRTNNAQSRLELLWEVMRAEMPSHFSDITFTPTSPVPLQSAYAARYNAVSSTATDQHEQAECLFLWVTTNVGVDDEVKFLTGEIGDADNDGLPEFHDAWGNPITWLRWPSGFVPGFPGVLTELQVQNQSTHPDPFDPFGAARNPASSPFSSGEPSSSARFGYKLYPLILSAGPSGEYGIYTFTGISGSMVNNPYSRYEDTNDNTWHWPGEPTSNGGLADSIHNHLPRN